MAVDFICKSIRKKIVYCFALEALPPSEMKVDLRILTWILLPLN